MQRFIGWISEKFSNDKFVAAVLVIAGFFVYFNALANQFVWDDEEQVVKNAVIRDWNNFPLIFTSSTFYGGGAGLSGGFYRPLVTLSYFWNYSYWGLNPSGYHLMQLLFHCANAFLVFYLLKIIFEKNNVKNRFAALSTAAFNAAPKLSVRQQKIAVAVSMAIIIALGARTVIRNTDWRSGLSLYGHDIALVPMISPQGNFELENNYGVELFRAGRIDEAGEHFKRSIALQPNWSFSQNNLGAVLERLGDLEAALDHYRKAAEVDYYLAHENVAGILIKMKHYNQARDFLEKSLIKFPNNLKMQFDLAYLYSTDNIGNDKNAKQKALYLLSLILRADPQNQQAQQLYYMLQTNQKIEL